MAKKFCILPGQTTIRIAKTDGRVVLIGEEPRSIPEDLEKDALGLGAYTESQVADIKERLLSDSQARDEAENRQDELKDKRAEEIRQAIVLLVNEGDPEKFTGKKPKVGAIEALTGFDVTADERDAIFDEISQG